MGCETRTDKSTEEIEKEFRVVFEDFYEKYESEDLGFVDYYSDDVIRLGPSGQYTKGVEDFRKTWVERIENDSFDLLGFGEPQLIVSREQVVSFNEFDEIFISPESGDTTRYTGTWVSVWQKQPDDQWKIKMTTWHSN